MLLALATAAALAAAGAGAGAGRPSCARTTPPTRRATPRLMPPATRLDARRRWTATFVTTCGSFAVRLDVRDSPRTTASFVFLARRGFYDDTIFHRIVPGFVIQGGDPTGSGLGGPGYSVRDRPPAHVVYGHGVVAMAKTAIEPAGTSGSQFFVVTARDAQLPPDYAVLGRVVEGIAVVDLIGRFGNRSDPTGRPTRLVVLRRVLVSSS